MVSEFVCETCGFLKNSRIMFEYGKNVYWDSDNYLNKYLTQ